MQFVVLPWQDKLGTNFRKTIEKDDGVSHLQRWSGPIPAAEEEPDWMKLSVAGAETSFYLAPFCTTYWLFVKTGSGQT
jgi:hypothetical protein